ncbi:hypothetical protein Pelo_12717 [Pelomyxa schiedti]|nr:hypothetical protein Pelo_12717 [Pelomyxa schiedti]
MSSDDPNPIPISQPTTTLASSSSATTTTTTYSTPLVPLSCSAPSSSSSPTPNQLGSVGTTGTEERKHHHNHKHKHGHTHNHAKKRSKAKTAKAKTTGTTKSKAKTKTTSTSTSTSTTLITTTNPISGSAAFRDQRSLCLLQSQGGEGDFTSVRLCPALLSLEQARSPERKRTNEIEQSTLVPCLTVPPTNAIPAPEVVQDPGILPVLAQVTANSEKLPIPEQARGSPPHTTPVDSVLELLNVQSIGQTGSPRVDWESKEINDHKKTVADLVEIGEAYGRIISIDIVNFLESGLCEGAEEPARSLRSLSVKVLHALSGNQVSRDILHTMCGTNRRRISTVLNILVGSKIVVEVPPLFPSKVSQLQISKPRFMTYSSLPNLLCMRSRLVAIYSTLLEQYQTLVSYLLSSYESRTEPALLQQITLLLQLPSWIVLNLPPALPAKRLQTTGNDGTSESGEAAPKRRRTENWFSWLAQNVLKCKEDDFPTPKKKKD